MTAVAEEHHGPPPIHYSSRVSPSVLGMFLFIASEIMLFGSFFTVYFFDRVVNHAFGGQWPPPRLPPSRVRRRREHADPGHVELHDALGEHVDQEREPRRAAGRARVDGAARDRVPADPGDRVPPHRLQHPDTSFAATFFGLTGLHGAHVLVGLTILSVMTVAGVQGPLLARAPSRRRDRRHLLALRRRDVDRRVRDRLPSLADDAQPVPERGRRFPLRPADDRLLRADRDRVGDQRLARRRGLRRAHGRRRSGGSHAPRRRRARRCGRRPRRTRPRQRRMLVVANETVGGAQLLDEIRERIAGRAREVLVVVPGAQLAAAPLGLRRGRRPRGRRSGSTRARSDAGRGHPGGGRDRRRRSAPGDRGRAPHLPAGRADHVDAPRGSRTGSSAASSTRRASVSRCRSPTSSSIASDRDRAARPAAAAGRSLRDVHRAALGAGALSDEWARERLPRHTERDGFVFLAAQVRRRARGVRLRLHGRVRPVVDRATSRRRSRRPSANSGSTRRISRSSSSTCGPRPSAQGSARGCSRSCSARQPHDRALLSTQRSSRKARGFYAKNGWRELAEVDFGVGYPPYLVLGKRLVSVTACADTSPPRSYLPAFDRDELSDRSDLRGAELPLNAAWCRRRPRPGARPSPSTVSAGRGSGRRCRSSRQPSACDTRRSRPRRTLPCRRASPQSWWSSSLVVVGRRRRLAVTPQLGLPEHFAT